MSMEKTGDLRLAYRIKDAAKQIGVSRSRLYQHIKAGRIRTIKDGARTLITGAELVRHIRRLGGEL